MVAGPSQVRPPKGARLERWKAAVGVKVRVDKILSLPQGLVLGLSVHGPKDSWVRFAKLEVPWSEVPKNAIEDYWSWADRDERNDPQQDEALPLDWG